MNKTKAHDDGDDDELNKNGWWLETVERNASHYSYYGDYAANDE
jgi:hypothetical protein